MFCVDVVLVLYLLRWSCFIVNDVDVLLLCVFDPLCVSMLCFVACCVGVVWLLLVVIVGVVCFSCCYGWFCLVLICLDNVVVVLVDVVC